MGKIRERHVFRSLLTDVEIDPARPSAVRAIFHVADADFVFDVRFLPNPFYDVALRSLSGKDAPVKAFLQADLNVSHIIDDIASFLMRWLPSFIRDNRAALTIGIGCTGGQHRSVYVVEELAQRFGSEQQVLIRHRDLLTAH